MARVIGPWIGRLGLRLALVFVAVALAAVAAAVISGSVVTSRDVDQLISKQRADAVRATAVAAAAAYDHAGWERADLTALTMLVGRAGAAVQVRNMAGQVVGASPDFASRRGQPQLTEPVTCEGSTSAALPSGSATRAWPVQSNDSRPSGGPHGSWQPASRRSSR